MNRFQLDVDKPVQEVTGSSRKGYWRLSKSLGTQTGMTNQWLEKQGLISVKELWVNIHYPTTVR